MALIMFIPLMVYQVIVVPRVLVPSVQTYGTWTWVVSWFRSSDAVRLRTSIALIKFLSEMRVDQPQEGMKYVQLFVWWQAITGTIQVGWLPSSPPTCCRRRHWLYVLLFHRAHPVPVPGFLRVYQYAMRGLQRSDMDQALNVMSRRLPT